MSHCRVENKKFMGLSFYFQNRETNTNHTIHVVVVPPLPPTGLQFSLVGTRTAKLSWEAPEVVFLNQFTSVSSYRVIARQTAFNISDVVADIAYQKTSYTFPSTLEEFTEYECEVLAGNSFGYGLPSQPVHFKTHETGEFTDELLSP